MLLGDVDGSGKGVEVGEGTCLGSAGLGGGGDFWAEARKTDEKEPLLERIRGAWSLRHMRGPQVGEALVRLRNWQEARLDVKEAGGLSRLCFIAEKTKAQGDKQLVQVHGAGLPTHMVP